MSNFVENNITPFLGNVENDTVVFIPEFLETAVYGIVLTNTIPLTPIQEGYLETNFTETVDGTTAKFRMSGEDNPSANGYDYADIQDKRDDFNHPLRGQAHYLDTGLEQSLNEIESLLEEGIILVFEKNK